MLVRANERPASLGEDDDYIPDLVGMDVVLEVSFVFHQMDLSVSICIAVWAANIVLSHS